MDSQTLSVTQKYQAPSILTMVPADISLFAICRKNYLLANKKTMGNQMTQAICIIGYSGSGKTTLIEKLVPALKKMGYRIGTIKHSRHDISNDKPGKDSYRHKAAGAQAVILAGPHRINLVREMDDPSPSDLLPYLDDMDLVLIEGFKHSPYPKILVTTQSAVTMDTIQFAGIAAIVGTAVEGSDLPCFDRDDIEKLAQFIQERFLKTAPLILASKRHAATDSQD